MPVTTPLRVYGMLLDMRHRQRTPDVFHPVSGSAAPRTTRTDLDAVASRTVGARGYDGFILAIVN
jgi:hypothetical protein